VYDLRAKSNILRKTKKEHAIDDDLQKIPHNQGSGSNHHHSSSNNVSTGGGNTKLAKPNSSVNFNMSSSNSVAAKLKKKSGGKNFKFKYRFFTFFAQSYFFK
jgi:hypothetical protein